MLLRRGKWAARAATCGYPVEPAEWGSMTLSETPPPPVAIERSRGWALQEGDVMIATNAIEVSCRSVIVGFSLTYGREIKRDVKRETTFWFDNGSGLHLT